jgi:hypothetical protein
METLESFATPFYHDIGFFGAYPAQECIDLLEKLNFDFIIRLTVDNEKNVVDYTTRIPMIYYPIKDNHTPQNTEIFNIFIIYISQLLIEGKKIFIHCKGGHGRSCLIITCLLYYLLPGINSREAIEKTIMIHNQRNDLSVRWKNIKSPFSKTQYVFLYKILNPICILKAYNTGYQAGFSGSSLFEIQTEYGIFSNLDAAFQSIRIQTEYKDFDIMLVLTRMKFEQYPELYHNLVLTGIRKIYDYSRYAFGENLIGHCLIQVRHDYMLKNKKDELINSNYFKTDILS